MTKSHLAHALGVLCACAGLATSTAPPGGPATGVAEVPKYQLSAPFTHDNLTIVFIRGKDLQEGKKFLTLDEALAAKKVIVHETKNVNELAIENVSGEDVFVQAGDIVKGGQQDRTIALDVVVPAKSGRLPLSSFCVEQGRWSGRGVEDAKRFTSSSYALANRDLKLACRVAKSQGEVWREVMKTQEKLKDNLKSEVKDTRSQTSLQLTLENKKVSEALEVHCKKLQIALDPKMTDVIGYGVIINGKVVSADVYANADLFRKLWPKLLVASAVEAVSEKNDRLKIQPMKPEVLTATLTAFLNEASTGKRSERKTVADQHEVQFDNRLNVFFETRAKKDQVIRRSYLAR